MTRHFERKAKGFIVTYKKAKFQTSEISLLDPERMCNSVYDAMIFPMKMWNGWEFHVKGENRLRGEEVFTMEKVTKTIIIDTENMFN